MLVFVGIVAISGCTSSDNVTPDVNYSSINNSGSGSNSDSVTNSASTSSSSGSYNSKASSSSSSSDTSGYFVGSSKSDVYHYSSCSSAKRIKSGNLVSFNSVQQARNAGYRPCKVCNPPG